MGTELRPLNTCFESKGLETKVLTTREASLTTSWSLRTPGWARDGGGGNKNALTSDPHYPSLIMRKPKVLNNSAYGVSQFLFTSPYIGMKLTIPWDIAIDGHVRTEMGQVSIGILSQTMFKAGGQPWKVCHCHSFQLD